MIEGTIESVCVFGAIIKLTDSITGLAHSCELLPGNAHAPTETIQTGEKVLVRILEINTDRQQVSLSMRRCPWMILRNGCWRLRMIPSRSLLQPRKTTPLHHKIHRIYR